MIYFPKKKQRNVLSINTKRHGESQEKEIQRMYCSNTNICLLLLIITAVININYSD